MFMSIGFPLGDTMQSFIPCSDALASSSVVQVAPRQTSRYARIAITISTLTFYVRSWHYNPRCMDHERHEGVTIDT